MVQNSIAAIFEIREFVASGGDVDDPDLRRTATAAVAEIRDSVDRGLLLAQMEAHIAAIMIEETYGSRAEAARNAFLSMLDEIELALRRR